MTAEIALRLINLSPSVGESCYEVEWALIHLAEHLDLDDLQSVVSQANEGEVKRVIRIRLNNAYARQNG